MPPAVPRGVRPDRPRDGQESVWDYPRPPALVPSTEHVEIVLGGQVVAATDRSWRVLETSHPPTYYLPRSAFTPGSLRPAPGSSFCEWKGVAAYLDVVGGDAVAEAAGWFYPDPVPAYVELTGHVAVYPGRVERCTVDGETVHAQPGGFYGGWLTSRVAGPVKGGPGSTFW